MWHHALLLSFFTKTLLSFSSKKIIIWRCTRPAPQLSAYICLLHHYSSCTYAHCTITARVYPQMLQKLKSCNEFVEITGYGQFSNYLTAYSLSPNRITILLSYKRRFWGLISKLTIRTVKLCPISLPLLSQDIVSFCEILPQHTLIIPFFLHSTHSLP